MLLKRKHLENELLKKQNQQLKEELVIKHNQLEEVRNSKTDYTKVNILEMQLDLYKKVIEEVREYINRVEFTDYIPNTKNYMRLMKIKCDLLQILDKVKE